MKNWIRIVGTLLVLCLLLYGCSSGTLEAPKQLQEESAESTETEEPLDTAGPVGWHKVEVLGLTFNASNDWVEEVSTEDEAWKTVNYPLSNGQYYTITVIERTPISSQALEAAKQMAEELETNETSSLNKNDQIQVQEWTNGSVSGQMITYRTRYSKEFYEGYKSGYESIIQDNTSYGKVLIILQNGKQYDFRITAYQDVDEAFELFDMLTASIDLGEVQ